MMLSYTDEQLVLACQKDDGAPFEELMRRYVKPIFRFARQYAIDETEAEDITQETLLKAWKYVRRFKAGMTFRPWVYSIARNTAIDYTRKRHSTPFSQLDGLDEDQSFVDTIEDTEPLASEISQLAESAAELGEAMEAIHPDHRAVLIMHYHGGLTFEEISSVMGRPMNTVKSWHRRALSKMKELLRTKE